MVCQDPYNQVWNLGRYISASLKVIKKLEVEDLRYSSVGKDPGSQA